MNNNYKLANKNVGTYSSTIENIFEFINKFTFHQTEEHFFNFIDFLFIHFSFFNCKQSNNNKKKKNC